MRVELGTRNTFFDYINVLKPRETILLTFIGTCAGIIAAGGFVQPPIFVLLALALLLGSAGSNGLTNYLDREVDAKMERTKDRALASGRLTPPQKALPLISGLIIIALALAWVLHPLCFVVGLIGVISSAIWRKTISCTFLGMVAGCSPVLIGWFAVKPVFNIEILLICCLVAIWIPIHVWSVMVASREDYMSAGLSYFPLSLPDKTIVSMLFALSVLLYLAAMLIYRFGSFGLLYLVVANILSILMIYANARLLFTTKSSAAWRVYKLSAFPYLGIIFFTMSLDVFLM